MWARDSGRTRTHEKAVATNDAEEHVHGGLERVPQRRIERGDVVPVEAEREESQSFVSRSSAEKIGDNKVVLIGQADDRHACQDDENVLGEHRPYEEGEEDNIPHPHALFGNVLLAMDGLQKGGYRQSHWPQHFDRVDNDFAEEACNSEA